MDKIICDAINRRILKKIIFSKYADPSILKTVATPTEIKGEEYIQFETFHSDGKATHKNIKIDLASEVCLEYMVGTRQCNVLTTAGECQILISKKGKVSVLNHIKSGCTDTVQAKSHNKDKEYLIPEGKPCIFLEKLGVCDRNGNVFDRRRAKFRQINRFLEMVDDVKDKLPKSGEIYLLDLCCGKSYLSFALYHYLCNILGRKVKMVGIDLKPDVIEYCRNVASDCGFDGLEFICDNINNYTPLRTPDMVVSLHACDIATDIVLAKAITSKAKIIISTPCCQHEMAKQLPHDDTELGFIFSLPILRARFCDITTDALRVLRLEAEGYRVQTLEFIDPEETPKNLMIRGLYTGHKDEKKLEEYNFICQRFNINPFLKNLLK